MKKFYVRTDSNWATYRVENFDTDEFNNLHLVDAEGNSLAIFHSGHWESAHEVQPNSSK